MKKFLLFLLCFISMEILIAQEKPTVVVIPFEAANNLSQEDVDLFTELFISEYSNTGKATVVDRNRFDNLQAQLDFQTSDWSDSNKIAELGNALNAEQIIIGTFSKFREQIVFNVRVLALNTAILSSEIVKLNDIAELFDLLPEICKNLSAKIYGETGTKNTSSSEKKTNEKIVQKKSKEKTEEIQKEIQTWIPEQDVTSVGHIAAEILFWVLGGGCVLGGSAPLIIGGITGGDEVFIGIPFVVGGGLSMLGGLLLSLTHEIVPGHYEYSKIPNNNVLSHIAISPLGISFNINL